LLVLVAAVVAFAAVLFIHHKNDTRPTAPAISDRPRLLRAAEAMLHADPSIADLVYTPARDRWDVTPANAAADPGSFARYVCFLLETHGVVQPRTSVRVIDDAALETNGFDYNAASRGTLTCNERTR
jgi:hypothetical protein